MQQQARNEPAASIGARIGRQHRAPVVAALRLLAAVVLVAVIITRLNLGALWHTFGNVAWAPVVAMVVCAGIFTILGGVNVWIILSALAPLHFTRVLRYHIVSTAFGTFTPASLGDFSLAAFVRREGVPVQQGLSALVIDRGITLILCVVVYFPCAALVLLSARQWLWIPVAVGLSVIGLLAVNFIGPLRRWVRAGVIQRFAPRFEAFFRTFSDLLRTRPRYLVANGLVSVGRSFVAGLVVYLALLSVDAHAGFLAVVAITNSLTLINRIPISLGGIGLYEGGAVAAFGRLGLGAEQVFVAFVIHRAYVILSSSLQIAFARCILPVGRDRASHP